MNKIEKSLSAYIDAGYPIIYINHFNFKEVDDLIKKVKDKKTEIREYNNSYGDIDFETKKTLRKIGLGEFLDSAAITEDAYENDIFLILKDVKVELKSPEIISKIRRIVEKMLYDEEGYSATIFIVSSAIEIPKELEVFVSVIEIEPPDTNIIKDIIKEFCIIHELDNVDEDLINELLVDFRGL